MVTSRISACVAGRLPADHARWVRSQSPSAANARHPPNIAALVRGPMAASRSATPTDSAGFPDARPVDRTTGCRPHPASSSPENTTTATLASEVTMAKAVRRQPAEQADVDHGVRRDPADQAGRERLPRRHFIRDVNQVKIRRQHPDEPGATRAHGDSIRPKKSRARCCNWQMTRAEKPAIVANRLLRA